VEEVAVATFTETDVARAWELLGLDPQRLLAELQQPFRDIDEARAALRSVQSDVRKAYRKAALKLHPDHGGDPADFRLATTLKEEVEALDVCRRPAAPNPPPIRWGATYTNVSTTASTTDPWGGWVEVTYGEW
jgi:hypothetical protein